MTIKIQQFLWLPKTEQCYEEKKKKMEQRIDMALDNFIHNK